MPPVALTDELPGPDERRRSPRMRARAVDLLLETAVFSETVRLINIGRLGFSVATPIAYPTGTPMALVVPGHRKLAARAVWFTRNQLGARFDEPLDTALLLILSEGD